MFDINSIRPADQYLTAKEHIKIVYGQMVQDSTSTFVGIPIGTYLFIFMLLKEINAGRESIIELGLEPHIIDWFDQTKRLNSLFVKQQQLNYARRQAGRTIAAD